MGIGSAMRKINGVRFKAVANAGAGDNYLKIFLKWIYLE